MQTCIKNNKKMEKEKYYTPIIEEFGFDFEFEVINSKDKFFMEMADEGWVNVKVGLGVLANLNNIYRLLLDKQIRVKYLDREDIESFGFELMDKELMEKYKLFRQLHYYILGGEKSNGNGLIILQHDWLNDKITIQTPNYIRDGSGRFNDYIIYVNRLKCKNKSEFSRLLKQLSII